MLNSELEGNLKRKTRSLAGSILFTLLFLLAPAVHGQTADANIVGTVTDATGAVVADAALTLENVATGVQYNSTTDGQGSFRFGNVPVGRYSLTVTKAGFTTQTIQNIQLELNRTSTVNPSLQVGAVATTVEVREAAALIDTTTATVQTTFTTRQAEAMPITGIGTLGAINLSLLSAGVSSSGGVGYGTGPSVGGQRPTNNNFMIEGVDNNNRSITGPVVNVSNEFTQEFSLQQNQFSPEFGHSTGGQFNTVVRSGTNEFHGSIYNYFQNRNLNAVDESFARIGIRENPRYDYNRLGATIGGPILRNRLFFFGGLEYAPEGAASTSAGAVFVPTAAGVQQLAGLPGIRRENLEFFQRFVPTAGEATRNITVAGQQIPVGLLSVTGPAFTNTYAPVASLDFTISPRDQLRMRWLHTRQDTINTGGVNLPEFFTPVLLRNHIGSVAYFRNFTPTLLNELRFGWNRRETDFPVGDQQFPGLDILPNLTFNDIGLMIGPNSNLPQSNRSNTYQLANNVSWILGSHTLKFGYDGRKVNGTNFFVQRFRGDYVYESLERFLLDITPEFGQRSGGGFPFIGNMLSHYGFVNDEWRIRPNITLNLGLRYEWVGVPVGAQAQGLNALASVPGVLEFGAPRSTKRDFAPRLGIAWSPGQSGRTAIRAGFGMAYDQIYQNLGSNALPPQFFTTIDAHIDQANQPGFLAGGGIRPRIVEITDPARARALTSSYLPLVQDRPYSIQWNAGVQHTFGTDYTIDVRYLGTRGVHLPYQTQLNRLAAIQGPQDSLPLFYERPGQGELDGLTRTLGGITRPVHPMTAAGFLSTITGFTPEGNSLYHGLATQITRRYSNGLQLTGAYTWSHNIDDSTAALFSTVLTPRRAQDFYNRRAERSSSALDRRHRGTLGWVYDTPWFRQGNNWFLANIIGNWMFSGAYIYESGAPFTARSGVDSNMNGDNAGDRTVINLSGDPMRGSGVTPLCRSTGPCATNTAAGRANVVGYLVNDPSAMYVQAGEGVFPNGGRNTLRLPNINNFDLALGKRFNVTERVRFEIRGEAYNALNHPQYVAGFPSAANARSRTAGSQNALTLAANPAFNRPDLAFQSNARTMQIVGRITF
jgi:hypothetical protein